jgi:hypothetical protein
MPKVSELVDVGKRMVAANSDAERTALRETVTPALLNICKHYLPRMRRRESREQRAESREQRAESREQRAESRVFELYVALFFLPEVVFFLAFFFFFFFLLYVLTCRGYGS